MSDIQKYIKENVLKKRLVSSTVLLVYDHEKKFKDICLDLKDDLTAFVDAEDGIESRESAMNIFGSLTIQDKIYPKQLLIYIPNEPPINDDDKAIDPFSVYLSCGALFPDKDRDDYLNLCIMAKPDHETEIRTLFEQNSSPSFELVDNIGGGIGYPTLRTLLGVDSAHNILLAILVPSESQLEQLNKNETWVSEAKLLFQKAIGLKLATRGKTWSSIAGELWRFVLFSEFVFDLPIELPGPLVEVPRAVSGAKHTIYDLCDTIRDMNSTQLTYVERAKEVECELSLPEIFNGIQELGERDTFPFEERTFMTAAVQSLKEKKLDETREIIAKHMNTVWVTQGESHTEWSLVEAIMNLVNECDDVERELAKNTNSLGALIEFYVSRMREIDRLQREFEQIVGEYLNADSAIEDVIEYARSCYSKWIEKTQILFTNHLEHSGWPLAGSLSNLDVFDKFAAPILKDKGRRVAYFMVDALRYELGAILHRQILDTVKNAELNFACAAFPTITSIGMASLLPNATSKVSIEKLEHNYEVCYDKNPVGGVAERMGVFKEMFGDRFFETQLSEFLKTKKILQSLETIDLLVLRSTEIDSLLENNSETTLGLVHQTLKSIRVALNKLKDIGFTDAIIVADHGFFLNAHAEAGDVCKKPQGNWTNFHQRALLGDGEGDLNNIFMSTNKLGIRGDFSSFAAPKAMVPYKKGLNFFHGGPSLQEAIVPVITLGLHEDNHTDLSIANIEIKYRNGTTNKIHSRVPVFQISVQGAGIFSQSDIEILIEAHNKKGTVIGEVKRGGEVDAVTGTIKLDPGEQINVPIKMDLNFEGKFTLKVFNPLNMTLYTKLELETDYAI